MFDQSKSLVSIRERKGEEIETNKMQLIWYLLSNYLNMFRASLCPASGEQ